jgi:tetratricopeptide (TPR) repeat protein
LAVPSNALAQRDAFFSTLLTFYKTLGGTYGDEGPQLGAQLQELSTALERWDDEIRAAEQQLRPQLNGATRRRHYRSTRCLPRCIWNEAALTRRFGSSTKTSGSILVARHFTASRPGPSDQGPVSGRPNGLPQTQPQTRFRAAWLIDPADPQNAYRLLAVRSAQTTAQEKERAARKAGRCRTRAARPEPRARSALFTNVSGIVDDTGGGVAFVPAAYAAGFSLVLKGELNSGLAALRTAVSTDPLVIDPSGKTETMKRGISALRQGLVASAIEQFEATVALNGNSAEGHRMLATAYAVNGDLTRSLQHLREAVRLNPRDERARLALVRTLDDSSAAADTEDAVRAAIAELPDAGAFRWQLATLAARRGQTNQADLAVTSALDRYVVLVGRGELHIRLAKLAQTISNSRARSVCSSELLRSSPTTPSRTRRWRARTSRTAVTAKGMQNWSSR